MSNKLLLTGLADLVNPNAVRKGLNLSEIERSLIERGVVTPEPESTETSAEEEFERIKKEFELDTGDNIEERDDDRDSHSEYNDDKSERTEYSEAATNDYATDDEPADFPDDDDNDYSTSNYGSTNDYNKPRDPDLARVTNEQRRKEQINAVMGDSPDVDVSFEAEKREDVKLLMLGQIENLMASLVHCDVDMTRIQRVDRTSSFEEVERVLKLLRMKNDHVRCRTFAEECILFGAYVAEGVFDGKRKFFGRSPDLRGWHHSVIAKLGRMKYDTGEVVSSFMQDYNIGPFMRILLELFPSAIVYSIMKDRQKSQPNLSFSDDEMASISARISDLN
jgi:hypothetical protein